MTAGGIQYELEIPQGALLTPEDITMRPVAGFAGLPFAADPPAAVVITPARATLLKPAVLRIRNARAVPAAAQAGFAFRPDGTELHLTPLSLDPAVTELPITHLGGFEDRLAHLLAAHGRLDGPGPCTAFGGTGGA